MFASLPHSSSHYNQKPGQAPLFPGLPLESWGLCVLHLSLRVIGMLWSYAVLRDSTLNKKARKGRHKDDDDGSLASVVWAMLVAAGVHVKVRAAATNDNDSTNTTTALPNTASPDPTQPSSFQSGARLWTCSTQRNVAPATPHQTKPTGNGVRAGSAGRLLFGRLSCWRPLTAHTKHS